MELTRIERMRRAHLRAGPCPACGRHSGTLELHHEHYDPDMTIFLCHECHHARHFYPQRFPEHVRLRIARARTDLSDAEQRELAGSMTPCGKRDLS